MSVSLMSDLFWVVESLVRTGYKWTRLCASRLSALDVVGCWPLTGKPLMAKQKPFIWMLAAVILLVSVVIAYLLYYQAEQRDPCKQKSRLELAEAYPALAELLLRQRYESDQLLARQRAQDFMINLEMSSEQLDLEDALKTSTQQIEAIAALRQRHSQAFDVLCQELVSK